MKDHRTASSGVPRDWEMLSCLSCGSPAEVEWRTPLQSTDGDIEHMKVRCIRQHWYLMPADLAL
jgi:hypothetical protein